jgi:hypothetical protein
MIGKSMKLDRKALVKFCSDELQPRLAGDFKSYNSAIVRTIDSFAQMVVLSGGRYGETLKVMPTFYVFGARPWEDSIPQSVALDAESPNRWRFSNPSLDSALANSIASMLRTSSPLSFEARLTSQAVVTALQKCSRLAGMESAALFLGFYLMSTGKPGASTWLESARASFLRENKVLEHEWQSRAKLRFDELLRRVADPNAREISHAEADRHAAMLRIQTLRWSE